MPIVSTSVNETAFVLPAVTGHRSAHERMVLHRTWRMRFMAAP